MPPISSIAINHLASGLRPPTAANPTWPNVLHTRIADVVAAMGPAPWARRLIADERQLVTLIAAPPGGGNRPHWHADFDEWWVVFAGHLEWELTGGVVVRAKKDDIVWRDGPPHPERRDRARAPDGRGHATGHPLLQFLRAVRLHRGWPERMGRLTSGVRLCPPDNYAPRQPSDRTDCPEGEV